MRPDLGYLEVSVNSPVSIPIFQFKTVIVVAGVLLLIQGVAQVFRAIHCMKTGEWLLAAEDVEETEVQLLREQEEAAAKHAQQGS